MLLPHRPEKDGDDRSLRQAKTGNHARGHRHFIFKRPTINNWGPTYIRKSQNYQLFLKCKPVLQRLTLKHITAAIILLKVALLVFLIQRIVAYAQSSGELFVSDEFFIFMGAGFLAQLSSMVPWAWLTG
jgi:hypothetical protein